jgi:hypothetical protein
MTSRTKTDDGTAPANSPFAEMFQAPAANSFLISQRFALEAARFWARRMRAYADQMETLAGCASPNDLATAQTKFLERLREDYATETEAMSALLASETQEPPRAARRRNGGEANG